MTSGPLCKPSHTSLTMDFCVIATHLCHPNIVVVQSNSHPNLLFSLWFDYKVHPHFFFHFYEKLYTQVQLYCYSYSYIQCLIYVNVFIVVSISVPNHQILQLWIPTINFQPKCETSPIAPVHSMKKNTTSSINGLIIQIAVFATSFINVIQKQLDAIINGSSVCDRYWP